jgi:phytoene synthase
MSKQELINRADIDYCKTLAQRHGKSYFFATQFFPRELREATYILYAFFRLPDDMIDVDDPSSDIARKRLEGWKKDWREAYFEGHAEHPVLRAAARIFKKYSIPFEYSESFLEAMLQDGWKRRYASYAELEGYMYGSAAVVGLMMTHVIGFNSQEAFKYAKKLGFAMQLTNFLRDIREDVELRDRIYLPQTEMRDHGLTEEMIKSHEVTSEFIAFMKWQIARARKFYAEAEEGIELLHPRGRLAVRLASRVYGGILDKIEDADYNVFTRRVKTSLLEKVWYLITIWKKRSS